MKSFNQHNISVAFPVS